MADWRVEHKKLCELADFPDDVDDREYRGRVFDVQDVGARKALIAHNIRLRQLVLNEAYLDVELRQYRVEKARTEADNWWMLPSSLVVLFCIGSQALEQVKISPTIGAIAVAACGLMLGLNHRDVCMRAMREAVREARSELAEAKNWLEECRCSKGKFLDVEAKTGRRHAVPDVE